jgi:hypothetical protein
MSGSHKTPDSGVRRSDGIGTFHEAVNKRGGRDFLNLAPHPVAGYFLFTACTSSNSAFPKLYFFTKVS